MFRQVVGERNNNILSPKNRDTTSVGGVLRYYFLNKCKNDTSFSWQKCQNDTSFSNYYAYK